MTGNGIGTGTETGPDGAARHREQRRSRTGRAVSRPARTASKQSSTSSGCPGLAGDPGAAEGARAEHLGEVPAGTEGRRALPS
ncbi:hypothetical protein C2142_05865 [Streptomyces sp. CB01881]|nr:hypothetical protein C2142_05865 [Streptomyces sp. CB01881]